MHAVLWIALIASSLAGLGGLVLAYMFIRWGARSDKKTGWFIGAFALGQVGLPILGFAVAHAHRSAALLIGLVWGLVSIVFLLLWPAFVSAAGQP